MHVMLCRLAGEVAKASEEAADCVRFLKPLRAHLTKITEMTDFAALPDTFGPLMQIMLLIWRHSKYFNTPAKLLALVRRIGNALITQAKEFLPGEVFGIAICSELLLQVRVIVIALICLWSVRITLSIGLRALDLILLIAGIWVNYYGSQQNEWIVRDKLCDILSNTLRIRLNESHDEQTWDPVNSCSQSHIQAVENLEHPLQFDYRMLGWDICNCNYCTFLSLLGSSPYQNMVSATTHGQFFGDPQLISCVSMTSAYYSIAFWVDFTLREWPSCLLMILCRHRTCSDGQLGSHREAEGGSKGAHQL